MGWTIIDSHNAPKTYKEEREFLVGEFSYVDYESAMESEVIAASKVGSVWYMAINIIHNTGAQSNHYENTDDYTFCLVVMTSRRGGEFMYKDIAETAGPMASDAPQKILKLLSNLADEDSMSVEWAGNWRKRCADNVITKVRIKSLDIGTKIKVSGLVVVNDVGVDEFTVSSYTSGGKNRRCYHNPKVGMVRLDFRHLDGMIVIN